MRINSLVVTLYPPKCANHIHSQWDCTELMNRFWCQLFADWLERNNINCFFRVNTVMKISSQIRKKNLPKREIKTMLKWGDRRGYVIIERSGLKSGGNQSFLRRRSEGCLTQPLPAQPLCASRTKTRTKRRDAPGPVCGGQDDQSSDMTCGTAHRNRRNKVM